MSALSSSGVPPSSAILSGSTPSARRMRSLIAVSTTMNGVNSRRKKRIGRARRRATLSALSIT